MRLMITFLQLLRNCTSCYMSSQNLLLYNLPNILDQFLTYLCISNTATLREREFFAGQPINTYPTVCFQMTLSFTFTNVLLLHTLLEPY